MKANALLPLSFLALPLPTVYAWGTLGHTTVAYVAQHFVSAKTAKWAKSILNDTSDSYLANSATWADSYRYTAEGGFSSVFHYIDALDNPPQTCNVVFERDCPEEGCIVSALANYTQRVKSKKFPAIEVQKALKWIIHFTGDITQPLHDENLMIGGNLINVTFNGLATNLHASWDTRIPEKRIGGYNLTYASSWASTITHSIEKGAYRKSKKSWLRNLNVRHPLSTAMTWARDGNSFVCTAVIPNGVEAVERKEIGGDYADMAFPVVEQQIAKAGYRLAAWLNLLATGHAGLPTPGIFSRDVEEAATLPVDLEQRKVSKVPNAAQLTRRAFGIMDCGCEHH